MTKYRDLTESQTRGIHGAIMNDGPTSYAEAAKRVNTYLMDQGWTPPQIPRVTVEPTNPAVRLLDPNGDLWARDPLRGTWSRGGGHVDWLTLRNGFSPLYVWEG